MFSEMGEERIRGICNQFDWNVDRCVDFLISTNEQSNSVSSAGAANNIVNTERSVQQYGAIPKNKPNNSNVSSSQVPLWKRLDNSIGHHFGSNNNDNFVAGPVTFEVRKIAAHIADGNRILVIMRGAPGSGKSYLAKSLVQHYFEGSTPYSLQDFVLSTDDYFYDAKGRYHYNPHRLDDAHNYNQRRVNEKTATGWSPIIVDNTNMKIWEMMPYVQMAVKYNYVIELLEPNTPWRNSPGKLALKTGHGVPREKIQIMLEKYEKANTADLVQMLKHVKYSAPLPQKRTYPPILIETKETASSIVENQESLNNIKNVENNFVNTPKVQRVPNAKQQNITETVVPNPILTTVNDIEQKIINREPPSSWKPYESEASNFWQNEVPQNDRIDHTEPKEAASTSRANKSLLELLKESVEDNQNMQLPMNETEAIVSQPPQFHRHALNCPNENKSFASFRQIYPNKSLAGLWDLFVKCNGDIDWAVDILLKEDDLSVASDERTNLDLDNGKLFACGCNTSKVAMPEAPIVPVPAGARSQRLRPRGARSAQRANNEAQEVIETIENRFVLANEHYSPHTRKIRDKRNGVPEQPAKSVTDEETQTENVDEEQDEENADLIEVSLGDNLITQLRSIFTAEHMLGEKIPENFNTNIFLPRSLAKELYMLWIESVYNHVEEQRHQTLKEDEKFARLLTNPKYAHFTYSPNNTQEILDMEIAWKLYKSDQEEEKQKNLHHQPTDLAAYLTQMKLFEEFPTIPRDTLLDVLAAHNNKYNETVEVLNSNVQNDNQGKENTLTRDQLMEYALRENEILTRRAESEARAQQVQLEQTADDNGLEERIGPTRKLNLTPAELKRKALDQFERARNSAAHHCQLRAECLRKASEAVNGGNGAVSLYYTQIAALHKKKIDLFNHQAANCIVTVHQFTQNNPDLLDLHYLHLIEAIHCLDVFLDRHISNLRGTWRTYKHVFIITGRGLHSAGGISTIKNRVRVRLRERNLRWSDVNPGLLKVKVFSASQLTKQCRRYFQ